MSKKYQVENQAINFRHIPDKELEQDFNNCNNEDDGLAELIVAELKHRKLIHHGLHL